MKKKHLRTRGGDARVEAAHKVSPRDDSASPPSGKIPTPPVLLLENKKLLKKNTLKLESEKVSVPLRSWEGVGGRGEGEGGGRG